MGKIEVYPISMPKLGAGGKTGSWRTLRPVLTIDKCTKCQTCYIACPEGVINRDTMEINLEYCKGCGICAMECKKNAIEMVREENI